MKTKTAEFVSPKHPDKICDYIADCIVDAYIEKDPFSHTAIEIMGGHKTVYVTGEVKSQTKVNVEKMVREMIPKDYKVFVNISEQSSEIVDGINDGGAGDQGIMVGYACNETKNFMPLEYELARNLCKKIYEVYPYDGKTQVTVENGKVKKVVASFQNAKIEDLKNLVESIIKSDEYIINPAGDWDIGGFDADSGLTGRKIIVDAYGPNVPVGGGAFSGKDPTKVDRSGAYMARKIALDYLKKYNAKEVLVKLAYAIGKKNPVMQRVVINGKEEKIKEYDLTPEGIISFLDLRKPIYKNTAIWGHFGRKLPWDRI
jgi:S-adenosylmethionine synthetase